MPVIQSNAVKSSYGRLTYLFNEPAHTTKKTNKRVLSCTGFNINMIHAP